MNNLISELWLGIWINTFFVNWIQWTHFGQMTLTIEFWMWVWRTLMSEFWIGVGVNLTKSAYSLHVQSSSAFIFPRFRLKTTDLNEQTNKLPPHNQFNHRPKQRSLFNDLNKREDGALTKTKKLRRSWFNDLNIEAGSLTTSTVRQWDVLSFHFYRILHNKRHWAPTP